MYVDFGITREQISTLHGIFCGIDTDNSGGISFDEYRARFDPDHEMDDFQELFDNADYDEDGKKSY